MDGSAIKAIKTKELFVLFSDKSILLPASFNDQMIYFQSKLIVKTEKIMLSKVRLQETYDKTPGGT